MGSASLPTNAGSEESDVKESLEVYADMALRKSSDLISCAF